MIFPGFPGVPSFFQVFQVEWEPWKSIAKIPGEILLRIVQVRREMTRNWITILKLVQTKIKFGYFNGMNGPTGDRVKSKRIGNQIRCKWRNPRNFILTFCSFHVLKDSHWDFYCLPLISEAFQLWFFMCMPLVWVRDSCGTIRIMV